MRRPHLTLRAAQLVPAFLAALVFWGLVVAFLFTL